MMVRLFAAITLLVSISACKETEECKQLSAMLKERKDVLRSARAQAGAFEIAQKRAMAAEGNANKLLGALGLNDPETKLDATIERRVAAIPGAKFEKTTTPTNVDDQGNQLPGETMWRVQFSEPSIDKAFTHLEALIASPPLFKLSAVIRDRNKEKWNVEIIRAAPDQVPINPSPTPLPGPADLASVPSQLGFCGATSMRDEIDAIDSEVATLKEKAEKTTVLLPKAVSYEGLRGRAEFMRDTELENRKLAFLLRDAAMKSQIPLKSLGVEGNKVLLEVWGGTKERARIEQEMVKLGIAERVQIAPTAPQGVVRFMMANTLGEAKRRRDPRARFQEGAPQ